MAEGQRKCGQVNTHLLDIPFPQKWAQVYYSTSIKRLYSAETLAAKRKKRRPIWVKVVKSCCCNFTLQ